MSTAAPTRRATCIIVNGPSSGGKSTLCAALQDKLVELADGEQGASFACVAFDDFLGTLSTRYYPHSFTALIKGDIERLASKAPFDGRAGWEYIDESENEGQPGAPGTHRRAARASREAWIEPIWPACRQRERGSASCSDKGGWQGNDELAHNKPADAAGSGGVADVIHRRRRSLEAVLV
jgi:hypothetical protein